MDGSARQFMDAIESAGIQEQEAIRVVYSIDTNIHYYDPVKNVDMLAVPSTEYQITALIDFNSPVLGTQLAATLTRTLAGEIAETFNVTANYTRIGVYVITGRVASDDVEAVRAINSEVQALLSAMEKGVQNLDATAIRDAANKARELGSMLSPDAQERMQVAIDAARSAARRIKKAGEGAALIIDTYAIGQITAARTAFIDLDDAREVAAPVVDGRAVDFTPDESTSAEIKAAFALDFDEPAPTKSAAPTAYGAALQLEF